MCLQILHLVDAYLARPITPDRSSSTLLSLPKCPRDVSHDMQPMRDKSLHRLEAPPHCPCSLHPCTHARYTMHPAPCTLRLAHCAMRTAPCTLHPAPRAPHSAPCRLRPAPCALHPAPCALHPAPRVLRHASFTSLLHRRVAGPHCTHCYTSSPHFFTTSFNSTPSRNLPTTHLPCCSFHTAPGRLRYSKAEVEVVCDAYVWWAVSSKVFQTVSLMVVLAAKPKGGWLSFWRAWLTNGLTLIG